MKFRINLQERELDKLFNVLENGDAECELIVHKIRTAYNNSPEVRKAIQKSGGKRVITQEEIEIKKQIGLTKKQELAEKYRAELILKQTKAEKRVKAVLKSIEEKYEFQHIMNNDRSWFIVDFYLPYHNIVIEVDGEYHNTPEQIKADTIRSKTLLKVNRVKYVARILNDDTKNGEQLRRKLKAIIEFSKTLK